MPRFDVFEDLNNDGYLLDVQSDILDGLNTRVVIPLMSENKAPDPADRLNLEIEIDGKPFIMVTQYLASVRVSILKKPVLNLSN